MSALSDAVDFAKLEGALQQHSTELKGLIDAANNDIKEQGKTSHDTSQGLEVVAKKCEELTLKLHEMEQKSKGGPKEDTKPLSLGEQFTKSAAFAGLVDGSRKTARLEVKAAIINAEGQNQPLVPAQRLPGIQHEPNVILRIRDLLPTAATTSNMIEYVKENAFTNSAASQYDDSQGTGLKKENVLKAESGITFTMENAPVVTIAHWIPASRQVLDDAPQLESYINTRMAYGLKLQEEGQLLTGDSSAGELNGILNQATDDGITPSSSINEFDVIRKAITKAQKIEYYPDAVVMNPTDVEKLDLLKEASDNNNYVSSNPRQTNAATVWGLPVVVSNSISENEYLMGSFVMGAQIWDREQSRIDVSLEDGDNFRKNMVTIRSEERIALTVYRPAAFIKGTLTA